MRGTGSIESWLRGRSEGLAELALLEAQRDAARARASAYQQRDAAQRTRLQQLRRAADRVAAGARAGVAGAVLQGACGLVSSTALFGKIGVTGLGRLRWLDAAVRSADSVARVDPFRAAAALRESERAGHQLRATQAEHAAQRADDQLRESQRLSAGYLQRLQALAESRQAAAIAMLRR